MKTAHASAMIDDRLKFVLFGLQSRFRMSFSGKMVERIFLESDTDQVAEKHYGLFHNTHIQVNGHVGAYEPETILITVISNNFSQQEFDEMIASADIECYRLDLKGA